MTKKIPHQKKKGAITRSDMNLERMNAKEVLNVAKRISKHRRTVHLVKNIHSMEYETHIQTPRI